VKETYLVQRLDRKPESEWHAQMSRVFGGGMIAMSKAGWEAIQSVCNLHYMGAAEYEFGTIPECLGALHNDHEKLVTFELKLKRSQIKANWAHEHMARKARRLEIEKFKAVGKKPPRAKKTKPGRQEDAVVYVICRREHQAEVPDRIRELALDKIELKRGCGFSAALDPASKHDMEAVGWLELDNGFFFFVGYEEYAGMATLFGVQALPPPTKVETAAGEASSRAE